MEITFLGTGAAEGWPAPYCACPFCEQARREGGRNIRMRSGALIDDDLKIDHNGDTVVHMQRAGRSLARLRTLLFTHDHSDHFAPAELEWIAPPFTQTPPARPVAVYANELVLRKIQREFDDLKARNLELHLIKPLEPFETPTGDTVMPLPADHAPQTLLFRITRGGKNLFYGHDSGFYPGATIDALAAGPRLDIAIMDCTSGGVSSSNKGHMGVDGVIEMARLFRKRRIVHERSRIIATHFSHNGGLLHDALVRAFMPHQIDVAFDGMSVNA